MRAPLLSENASKNENLSLQMRNVTPQPYQPPRPFTAAAAAAPAMTVKRTSTDDLLQEYGLDFSKLTTTATATRPATLSTHHQPSLLLPTACAGRIVRSAPIRSSPPFPWCFQTTKKLFYDYNDSSSDCGSICIVMDIVHCDLHSNHI